MTVVVEVVVDVALWHLASTNGTVDETPSGCGAPLALRNRTMLLYSCRSALISVVVECWMCTHLCLAGRTAWRVRAGSGKSVARAEDAQPR